MTESTLISNFNLSFPYKDTLRRLGYAGLAEPDKKTGLFIKSVADESLTIIEPRGLYRICEIAPGRDSVKANGFMLESIYLRNLLKNCNIAVFMAVTVGNDICAKIENYMSAEPSKGVVLDASASELAESAMEKLHNMIKNIGLQKGYRTTIRYSPGYKDFGLHNQLVFDKILDLNRIGVQITPSYMLKPEKSITAIAGWEKNI